MEHFQYIVCQVQQARITFVNGQWHGTVPVDAATMEESLNSCPWVWDYLYHAGAEGWELVTATDSAVHSQIGVEHIQMLYMKKRVE